MCLSIAGVTFHFIGTEWELKQFSLCFFDTQDIDKSASGHTDIIATSNTDNDKLNDNVRIFSGTSDNEPTVALGVDNYFGFNGSVSCICHTLALAARDAIDRCDTVKCMLSKIDYISTFVNQRSHLTAKLTQLQYEEFSRDRLVVLGKECTTRLHSKLNVLENYVVLKPHL